MLDINNSELHWSIYMRNLTHGVFSMMAERIHATSCNRCMASTACLVDASPSNLDLNFFLPFCYPLLGSFILWQQRLVVPADTLMSICIEQPSLVHWRGKAGEGEGEGKGTSRSSSTGLSSRKQPQSPANTQCFLRQFTQEITRPPTDLENLQPNAQCQSYWCGSQ